MAGVWAGILATSVIWVVNLYGLSKKCTADSKQLFAVWTPNKRAAAQFQAIPVPPQTLILTSDFTERNRNLIYSIIAATIRESNCYFLKLQDTEWSTDSNRWFFFLCEDNGRWHSTCHVFTSHLSVIWWKRGVFKWLDTGCLWMDVYIASTKRFSAAETFHEGTTASKWFCSNLCIGIDDQLAQSVWHKFH